MWHPIKHYKTIHHHKMLVMKHCFRCGLYWQGTCSPNNTQRQAEGYSAAWLHH